MPRKAIAAGKCSIALITLAGKPRTGPICRRARQAPEVDFEGPPMAPPPITPTACVPCATCIDYGTTSEQLAWIKVQPPITAQ